MIKNTTLCNTCVKQDVCELKYKYESALLALSETNTTLTAYKNVENENILVTVSCIRYVYNSPYSKKLF